MTDTTIVVEGDTLVLLKTFLAQANASTPMVVRINERGIKFQVGNSMWTPRAGTFVESD